MKEMEEETEHSEITLGTGKLLGLFVGLVVICAIFFSLGFALGKNSGPIQTQMTETPASSGTSAAVKPEAGASTPEPTTATSSEAPAVAQPEAAPAVKLETAKVETKSEPQAEMTPAVERSSSVSDIVVQVAAVTRRGDAEILMNALRGKGYPALLASTASADGLFRVQVGPFVNLKEAEITKSRLSSDGYRPIVKR